jgi:hypothetical protein
MRVVYFFLQNAAAKLVTAIPVIATAAGSGDFVGAGAAVVIGGTDNPAVQGSSHSCRHFCFASHHV